MIRAPILAALSLVVACYSPNAKEGAFRCEVDQGLLCPEGLRCDQKSGLCVSPSLASDMGLVGLEFNLDAGTPTPPPTCDSQVRAGAFSQLTRLASASSAADETSLSLSPDSSRLYFMRQGGLYVSMIDPTNPKSAGAANAVSITQGPSALNGGSFASDGAYWFSGTDAGLTRLYVGTFSSPTALSVSSTSHLPESACPFFDPIFVPGDATGDLYLAYPLSGCGQSSYVAQGTADKNMGAFVSALMFPGYHAPHAIPGGLTLLVSSADSHRLYYAERPSLDVQWTGPYAIPLDSLGIPSVGDFQAVVSTDCRTIYLSSDRVGGFGGADLWAADIVFP